MLNSDQLKNYYKGKKILVTGGAGFVGSTVAEKLIHMGSEVTIFDNLSRAEESLRNLDELWSQKLLFNFVKGDIMDYEMLFKLIDNSELVFHYAALPSHRLAMEDPRSYAEVDIIGTVNVLESSRNTKHKPKILFASSNKVYGKQKPPFKEDAELFPEGPYGQAKKCAEEWCKQYNKYYDVPVVINRLHHIVGPRSQPDLALSIFVERVLGDKSPIVHGNIAKGKFESCSAAFTNVYDAVEGMLLSLANTENFDIFNIGASMETSVYDIAKAVIDTLNSDVAIETKQMYDHESLHHAADPTKAIEILNWSANTSYKTSVEQYINWRIKTGERKSARYRDDDAK